MERPAGSCGAAGRRRGARRWWPCVVKGPSLAVATPDRRRRAGCRYLVATGWLSRSPLPFSSEFCSEGDTLAVAFRVATGWSSRSTFGVATMPLSPSRGLVVLLGSGLLTLNTTGQYVAFRSEGGTRCVALWLRQGPCCVPPLGSDEALVAFLLLCRLAAGWLPHFGVRPSDAERNRSMCRVQIRRRHPGRRDLVATGWPSPSCSEGDTPMVAFRLFGFLFRLVLFRFLGPCLVCRRWPTDLLGVFPEGVPCCSALEGLSHSEVVSISWDPHPREPVEGVLRATSVLELAAFLAQTRQSLSHCLSLHWFRSHVVVLGVRPQLCQAAVLRVLRVLGGSVSPFAGVEAGVGLASRGRGRRVPLLAASGGGMVAVIVTTFPHDTRASGGFRFGVLSTPSSRSGCQSMVAPVSVVSRTGGVSRVWGGSACGPSTLWRSRWPCLWLQLLLCRVRGECGRSTCSCRSGAVGAGLAGSGLPYVEDACEPVQVQCSWLSSAHLSMCASRRLREPACCGTFTGAGLLPVEPDAELSRCFVCHVALPVGRCDTCLWLSSAWRWLVGNSREVLLEFFSVDSGGNEDYSALVSAVAVPPQGLRCAASVGLAGAFWRVFLERCLGGSDGGSSQDRPLSLLAEVLLRSALCLFRATVVLPLQFEVFCLVELRPGEVLPGWLLALLGGGSPQSCFTLFCALDRASGRCIGQLVLLVVSKCSRLCRGTLCVPGVRAVWFVSCAWRALADGGLVSAVGAQLAVLLVEAPVLGCGLPLARGRDSLRCVSPSSVFRWLLKVVMLHYGVVLPGVGASCFGVLFGANMVVVLLMLSAFRVLPLWASGGESHSMGPVSSRAVESIPSAAVLFQPLVHLCCTPLSFSAGGSTVCSCSSRWGGSLRRSGRGAVDGLVRSGGAASWSEEVVAMSREGPFVGSVLRLSLGGPCLAPMLRLGLCLGSRQVGCRDTRQKATCRLSLPGGDRVATGWSSCSTFGVATMRLSPSRGLVVPLEFGLLTLNATGRYVAFRSEGGTRCVALWLRQGPCHVPPLGSNEALVAFLLLCRLAAGWWPRFGVRPSDAERDRSICRVQIRRQHPGRHDLVATGWPSPSSSEGDTPVVAFRLFGFLFRLVLFRFLGPCLVSLFARCSALEGLSHSEVVSVSWDPHPREPVEGVLRATSVLELAAFLAQTRQSLSHCLSLRWFRSHVVVLGVRPQLGQAAVLRVSRVLGGSISPFAGAEAGVGLASRGRRRRIPLLAASGGGLVAVLLWASLVWPCADPCFWWFLLRCPLDSVVPFWVPVRGGIGECGFPTWWRVQGPGWFCLWALDLMEVEVAVLAGSFLLSEFLLLCPVRDCGSTDPDEAEHWLKETERIFHVMQCVAGDKLLLATFQLEKDTRFWWESMEVTRANGQFTWVEFKEAFNSKYFSKRHLVNTERMKAKRFINGLRPQYISQLAPLDIQTYTEMVKKAQILEDAMDFTDRINGKFVKKELTPGLTSAKPTNGKKRPFSITKGPSQERKPKNMTVLHVVFLLPPLSSRHLHACCVSCAGRHADVSPRKATPYPVAFRGRKLWQFSGHFDGFGVCLLCSRREDPAWSGGNAGIVSFFAFFVKLNLPSVAARLRGGFSFVFQFRAASQRYWADASSSVDFLLLYLGNVLVQEFEMVDRRDWGGGGDELEESTQHMIERIWESLTEIQMRMDQ
ncbi:hypothetical protein Taro_045874 [Colocasia esculenta]|uniref:Retrotransposon gag domain-containing protein n=1 Tax=Colocasia esculenta TaxID=4460 RepID=A0A843WNB0_COLES|nr:hypothetical protein [Colocasia esculenta]